MQNFTEYKIITQPNAKNKEEVRPVELDITKVTAQTCEALFRKNTDPYQLLETVIADSETWEMKPTVSSSLIITNQIELSIVNNYRLNLKANTYAAMQKARADTQKTLKRNFKFK